MFCFLVSIFNDILHHSSILYGFLQNIDTDFSNGSKKVDNVKAYLSGIRKNESFHSYYQATVTVVGGPSSWSDKKHNYKQLYFEVIDNTLAMLDDRFDSVKEFAFLDLLNPFFSSVAKGSSQR